MTEEKRTYRPLEELFADENPTLEKLSNVLKRASRKNVNIQPEEVKKVQKVCVRAELTKEQYKEIDRTLQSCIASLNSRKKIDATRGYEELSTYAYGQEQLL